MDVSLFSRVETCKTCRRPTSAGLQQCCNGACSRSLPCYYVEPDDRKRKVHIPTTEAQCQQMFCSLIQYLLVCSNPETPVLVTPPPMEQAKLRQLLCALVPKAETLVYRDGSQKALDLLTCTAANGWPAFISEPLRSETHRALQFLLYDSLTKCEATALLAAFQSCSATQVRVTHTLTARRLRQVNSFPLAVVDAVDGLKQHACEIVASSIASKFSISPDDHLVNAIILAVARPDVPAPTKPVKPEVKRSFFSCSSAKCGTTPTTPSGAGGGDGSLPPLTSPLAPQCVSTESVTPTPALVAPSGASAKAARSGSSSGVSRPSSSSFERLPLLPSRGASLSQGGNGSVHSTPSPRPPSASQSGPPALIRPSLHGHGPPRPPSSSTREGGASRPSTPSAAPAGPARPASSSLPRSPRGGAPLAHSSNRAGPERPSSAARTTAPSVAAAGGGGGGGGGGGRPPSHGSTPQCRGGSVSSSFQARIVADGGGSFRSACGGACEGEAARGGSEGCAATGSVGERVAGRLSVGSGSFTARPEDISRVESQMTARLRSGSLSFEDGALGTRTPPSQGSFCTPVGPIPLASFSSPPIGTPTRPRSPCSHCNATNHPSCAHVCSRCGAVGQHPAVFCPAASVCMACTLCGANNHTTKQHLCSTCGVVGDHRAMNCPVLLARVAERKGVSIATASTSTAWGPVSSSNATVTGPPPKAKRVATATSVGPSRVSAGVCVGKPVARRTVVWGGGCGGVAWMATVASAAIDIYTARYADLVACDGIHVRFVAVFAELVQQLLRSMCTLPDSLEKGDAEANQKAVKAANGRGGTSAPQTVCAKLRSGCGSGSSGNAAGKSEEGDEQERSQRSSKGEACAATCGTSPFTQSSIFDFGRDALPSVCGLTSSFTSSPSPVAKGMCAISRAVRGIFPGGGKGGGLCGAKVLSSHSLLDEDTLTELSVDYPKALALLTAAVLPSGGG